MPWQPNGTFLRVNPDYSATPSGELWEQDLDSIPSIKIIATRHDFHDQDLGQGIQATLNLDGLNSMRANMGMGGYKIINLGEATDDGDAPRYDQTALGMSFDDGLRELELYNRRGDLLSTVVIPSGSGGGGEGTVSSIGDDGNGTLEWSQDPITTIGTVGLKFIQAGQTFSGGIEAIVIDDYGRVTQVTTGAPGGEPDQSLTKDQSFTNALKIGITKTNASTQEIQINSAYGGPNGKAGVMSRDQVDALEAIPSSDDIMTLSGAQTVTGEKTFEGNLNMSDTVDMDFDSLARLGLPVLVDASNLQSPNPPAVGFLYVDNDGFVRIGT